MRVPPLVAVLASFLLACGQGKPGSDTPCQHDFDCKSGEGCVGGTCQSLPCGGCQPDQACGTDGTCLTAQGAACAKVVSCPAAYPCNSGGICAKACTLNADCDPGFVCNSGLKSCAQCTFNADCAGKPGKAVCDQDHGVCVDCNVDFDCVKALGSGHFCDAHVCRVGCAKSEDCNASAGETCDTSTTPGQCIQCHGNADCTSFGVDAQACDDTGHCVKCWGPTQAQANNFCGSGTPECNLTTRTCVACLVSNNQSGADCGDRATAPPDPHTALTCDPATNACVHGCQFDSQCGCPRTAPGNLESDCVDPDGTTHRNPDQEHCDKNRTTMAGVSGATVGACVQCTTSTHCEYKIKGTTLYAGRYATLNGARCLSDTCVEGCDTDADCWPDHLTSNGETCHLGSGANNHKCVSCECDSPGADLSWCDSARCGSGKVCDVATLSCRLKNQGEQCLHSNECGDTHDPTIGACLGAGALCVFSSHDGCGTGGVLLCSAGSQFGRCGVPCNDFCGNQCVSGTGCPSGSRCRQASDQDGSSNSICVASTCNVPPP